MILSTLTQQLITKLHNFSYITPFYHNCICFIPSPYCLVPQSHVPLFNGWGAMEIPIEYIPTAVPLPSFPCIFSVGYLLLTCSLSYLNGGYCYSQQAWATILALYYSRKTQSRDTNGGQRFSLDGSTTSFRQWIVTNCHYTSEYTVC